MARTCAARWDWPETPGSTYVFPVKRLGWQPSDLGRALGRMAESLGTRGNLRGRERPRGRKPRARLAHAHEPFLLSLLARRSRLAGPVDVAGLGRGAVAGQQGGAAEIARARRPGGSVSRSADLAAALQGLGQGDLVRILEVAADGQAARDARDAHAERAEQLREIERGGFALDVGVGGQDDLARGPILQAQQQFAHLQIVGADAVQRRERAKQDVVAPLELAGALHGEQIIRLLHDAEHAGVARGVGTDTARVLVGDVEADRAVDDALLDGGERARQLAHLLRGAFQQKKRQPLSRLGPDTGQALERVDEPRDGLGVEGHYMPRPGILSPAVSLPISCWTRSRDFRSASLHAASTRSSSIWASSLLMTSGSILMDVSSCLPLASTVTMPPPAVASTFFLPTSSCRASICACSFCASFIMLPKPFTCLLLPAGAAGPRPPRPGRCPWRPSPPDVRSGPRRSRPASRCRRARRRRRGAARAA